MERVSLIIQIYLIKNAKIKGVSFRRYGDKYSLVFIDPELCNTSGNIYTSVTASSKTKINWKLTLGNNMITTDCQYYSTGIPKALPKKLY